MLRRILFAILTTFTVTLWAAEIPRPSPDFVTQLTNGGQLKVSDFRGKVLCLTFILTT